MTPAARRRLRSILWLALPLAAFSLCTAPPSGAAPRTELRRDDILWLQRITYGLDTQTVDDYRRLGRQRFLDTQLRSRDTTLPAPIAAQIEALEISRTDAADLLAGVTAERQRINALPDGPEKDEARKALNEHGNRLAQEAAGRHVLRAIYSRAQLQEQMVWFWLNHFSVFQNKGNGRWLVGDYEERAVRPHALGRFRDLVLATLTHPAMLQYLDNAQNAAGRLNENYARELMELHTLGVDAGYTQHDVQELARVLTGVGIAASDAAPKLKPEWQRLYRKEGALEFNPARHDFGDKQLLGTRIAGGGFEEVEHVVDLLSRHPACARFVSRKLATYFLADDPPEPVVERMAKTFQRTDGDIAAVLETLFVAREMDATLGGKLKDPMHYVVSAMRLAYDGRPIANVRPVTNWLAALGAPLYGRSTPEGYPLVEGGWASSGQMSRRFEIARAIGAGSPGLFESAADAPPAAVGFPQLSTRLYFEAVEPFLSPRTHAALERAASQLEWNTYLLASPDFNYR